MPEYTSGTPHNHTHRPSKMATGQAFCQDCMVILVDPILEATDPRLSSTAFPGYDGPVGEHPENIGSRTLPMPKPLPMLLVDLWEGNVAGYVRAPAAPYIELISAAHHPGNLDEWTQIFTQWEGM